MSLIRKIGLERYPKVRDDFDSTCNLDRIEIVYDTYLEVSIKELTRVGRVKVEPTEIINLN